MIFEFFCVYVMPLIWQGDLFARAETHFLEQVTDTVLDEAEVKADLGEGCFLCYRKFAGQLTNVRQVFTKKLLLLGSSRITRIQESAILICYQGYWCEMSWKLPYYLLNPVIPVSRTSLLVPWKQISWVWTKTIPNLISWNIYSRRFLHSTRLSKIMEVGWPSFIQDYFKSIDVKQLRLSYVLDTYWSDHCRHTTSRLSWKTSTSQLLNLKNNCKRLMTSILPCVMSWDVQKTSNIDGYGDYFWSLWCANGRLTTWKRSMKSMPALSWNWGVDVNGAKRTMVFMFKNEP